MFRSKQWVCNFIALIILISWMCVDEVKADSIFCYPQTMSLAGEAVSTILLEVDDIEPTEMMCTRNATTSRQIVAQITNNKRVIKLSMALVAVTVLTLLLSNFYTTERVTEFLQLDTRTVVLTYIHNTDGKK